MTDLSKTIAPKSDQLNADDLIAGPITVTITRVSAVRSPDQPVSIYYEGDNGKPYKPCLSMRRLLIALWGTNGDAYAGRSVTLFRDPNVTFGPDTVGGIRISHMSHIDGERKIPLTVTRGKRKPYPVLPLLRVSTAIGIATSPQLRVMLVRDGSLLDDEGQQILAEMAEAHDFQLWVEAVDTTGKVGIVLEDGAVVAIDGEPAPEPEEIGKARRRAKKTDGDGEPQEAVTDAAGQEEGPSSRAAAEGVQQGRPRREDAPVV